MLWTEAPTSTSPRCAAGKLGVGARFCNVGIGNSTSARRPVRHIPQPTPGSGHIRLLGEVESHRNRRRRLPSAPVEPLRPDAPNGKPQGARYARDPCRLQQLLRPGKFQDAAEEPKAVEARGPLTQLARPPSPPFFALYRVRPSGHQPLRQRDYQHLGHQGPSLPQHPGWLDSAPADTG